MDARRTLTRLQHKSYNLRAKIIICFLSCETPSDMELLGLLMITWRTKDMSFPDLILVYNFFNMDGAIVMQTMKRIALR